jgi:hypothetical protein
MRANPLTDADWKLLGLEPGASLADVKQAFQRRQALYQADSLATYTLLSEDERHSLLARLEDAHQRIVEAIAGHTAPWHPPRRAVTPALDPVPAGPSPDPETAPGPYLRHHRRACGLNTDQVAAETRIRKSLIEAIEDQVVSKLPAPVYVRGFVIQLARLLHLDDPEFVARAYLKLMDEE